MRKQQLSKKRDEALASGVAQEKLSNKYLSLEDIDKLIQDQKNPKDAELVPLKGNDFNIRPEEAEVDMARKAGMISKAGIEKTPGVKYSDLDAKTEAEREAKFKEVSQKVWKEFALSGKVVKDDEGNVLIEKGTDLDARSSMGLFQLAGFDTSNTRIVNPSQAVRGRINVDTGDRHGVVVEDQGRTAYIDHHAPESEGDTSATKLAYELLTSSGLLKRDAYLDRLVDFVNHTDNKTYPNEEKYFKDSYRTVLGLQRFLRFHQLVEYFKEGRNPTEILSDEDFKKFNSYLNDDELQHYDLIKRSQQQKETIEQAEKLLPEMEKNGLIINTNKYGKIAVDIDNKLRAGIDGAKWYGCGVYLAWNPNAKSFFVSTDGRPLQASFGDGKKIRNTMWIKPRFDREPLKISLNDVLKSLADEGFEPSGDLKIYLETGQLPARRLVEDLELPKTDKEAERVMLGKSEEEIAAENAFLGNSKEVERNAQDTFLGKEMTERQAQDAMLGRDMTEREARDAMLGKVDIEEGEKEAIDTILGKETEPKIDKADLWKMSKKQLEESLEKILIADGLEVRAEDLKNASLEDLRQFYYMYNNSNIEAAVYKTEAEVKKEKAEQARLIDISRIGDQYALLLAEEELEQLRNHSSFWKRNWNRFKIRYNEAGFRREVYNRIRNELHESQNLSDLVEKRMLDRKIKGDASQKTYDILDSVLDAYEKEIVSAEEKGDIIHDDDVNLSLAEAFYKYAKGEYQTRAVFDAYINKEVVSKIQKLKGKFTSKNEDEKHAEGLLYAHNFYQLAEGYKSKIEAIIGENPGNEDAVRLQLNGLMNLDIQLGLKQRDLVNNHPDKEDLTKQEKFVDWTQSHFKGVLANPVVYGAFASMIGQAFVSKGVKFGATLGVGIATGTAAFMAPSIAGMIAGGAGGGWFARHRKGRELKQDQAMEARRVALGDENTGERSKLLRKFTEQRASDTANTFRANLESMLAKPELSDAEKAKVAEIEAKLMLEKEMRVDLIGVSSEGSGGYGVRMLEMNPMLIALRQVREKYNLKDENFDNLIKQHHDQSLATIKETTSEFEAFKKKEMRNAGWQGFGKGVATAAAIQYGVDLFRGHNILWFDDHKHGSVLGWMMGQNQETIQGALVEQHIPGVSGKLGLPQGYKVIDQGINAGRHLFAVGDSKGNKLIENLEIGQDGKINNASLLKLGQHGYSFRGLQHAADIRLTPETTASPAQNIDNALTKEIPGLAQHSHMDWHDEPGKRFSEILGKDIEFEGKQQMLYLNRDANGNVIVDVKNMLANIAGNVKNYTDHVFMNPDGTMDNKMEAEYGKWAKWVGNGLHNHMKIEITPHNGSKLSLDLDVDENGHAKLPEVISKHLTSLRSGELGVARIEVMSRDGDVLATATGHNFNLPPSETITGETGRSVETRVFDTDIRPPLDPDYVHPFPWVARKSLGAIKSREKAEEKVPGKPEKKLNPVLNRAVATYNLARKTVARLPVDINLEVPQTEPAGEKYSHANRSKWICRKICGSELKMKFWRMLGSLLI
jgi:hypothetical protein